MGRVMCSQLTDAILTAIVDGADIFSFANRRPMQLLTCGLEGYRAIEAERARARIRGQISRMKRQKLISACTERSYQLTSTGQKYFWRNYLPPLLTGGRVLVVSFDIPERSLHARHAFRHYLLSNGFRRIHRSVWISDRDWSDILRQEIATRHLRRWVVVYVGTRAISPD